MTTATLILLALFAVPLLRLGRPLLGGLADSGLNGLLGCLERRTSRLRGAIVGLALVVGLARSELTAPGQGRLAVLALALLALARLQRTTTELGISEWFREGPDLLPGAFFAASDQAFGPAGGSAPQQEGRTDFYDFREGLTEDSPDQRSIWPVIGIFITSGWMTRLIIQSERWLGQSYYQQIFDRGARVWGLTILWYARAALKTEGFEKVRDLPGRRLFLFTHVSQTDFAFGFPALDGALGGAEEVRLRFIIAKDHFIDNPLIHSVSGVGRCVEIAGMIPIDRRSTKDAVAAMEGAAELVARDPSVDLAIYPQGTRSRRLINKAGEALDAGFYSAAPPRRMREPLGHVKPGTAHLALDLVRMLEDRKTPIHLCIVGVEGAGALLAKGHWRLRPGVTLTYRVHDVLTLTAADVPPVTKRDAAGEVTEACREQARELTERIERALAASCRIDERLAALWADELGGTMPDDADLRRIYERALTLPPARRAPLVEKLRGLSETGELSEADRDALYECIEGLIGVRS